MDELPNSMIVKFTHAYRASLTLATVLLCVSGYAPTRGQSHHDRTIAASQKFWKMKLKAT
ncbi:MAG: hypothetical protein ABI041_04070 [Bdellovibrionia bacterium]